MSKPKPFNNPFGAIKLQQEAPKPAAGKGGPARSAPPPKAPAPLSKAKAKAASLEEDEAFLFLSSVGEVETVKKGRKLADPPPPKVDPRRLANEDTEVLTQLSELVAGTGTFEVSDSTELIEGAIANLDRRVLQKLRRGEYPLQGRLDLHGLTRAEAKTALETFLADARHTRKRCLLVVHGRGLNSPGEIPVLKASVQEWLTHGRLGQWVLAFSSARPHDGGAGAVYVLLRA